MAVHREVKLEDWPMMIRRRAWLVIVPAVAGATIALLVAAVLPKQYTSHTRVLVEAPIVPDDYVKPVVSDDLNRRLASMQGEILGRTHLQNLVRQFNLYGANSGSMSLEDAVDRLQKSIKVTPVVPTPGTLSPALVGFNVDVTLGQPVLAQQVCSEITNLFMKQNINQREEQSEDTTQFLGKQLEDAKTKLDEQDGKLAAFQRQYIGEQPEDEQTNLTMLSGTTSQLEAATQNLSQAEENQAFLQSMLTQEIAALKSGADGRSDPQSIQQEIADLQNQLLALRARYTDKHPAVIKVQEELADLRQKELDPAPAEQTTAPNQDATKPALEPPQLQQLRAQLHEADMAVVQRKKEQEQLQRQISVLQGRIQLSPVVQEQFKSLTRDYQTALAFYNDILKKRDEAQMATELERRQEGENFRVLDAPNLPQQASFPNKALFSIGGFMAGLLLGLALVHLAESRDKSIRRLRDIETYLGVPTLAVISSKDAQRHHNTVSWMGAPAKQVARRSSGTSSR